MDNLKGLHILLTYACNYECDHCFVWGSPRQTGTFTLNQLDDVFQQATDVGTIEEIYFEGGEAFLYYPILVEAVTRAKKLGFSVGIVSNGYWANDLEDAWVWLKPLAVAGLDRIELSCDLFHGDDAGIGASAENHPGRRAARELFLENSVIAIDPPTGYREPSEADAGLPLTGGGVMFRGRAAEKLVEGLARQTWDTFTTCPYEDLANPSRLHLDPFGNLHLCQGVVMGNLFERPLQQIVLEYDPEKHPIVEPILKGGPTQLTQRYGVDHEPGYVDACHLCYTVRQALRPRFPFELGPDQMYGEA